MNITLGCLLVLAVVICTYADPDPQFGYHFSYPVAPYSPNYGGFPMHQPPELQQPNYFRAGIPQSSIENQNNPENRQFFGTYTLTIATITSTSTTTLSVTCTTSTKAISICSPSGRRRRGLSLNGNKKVRGLFYNDDDEEADDTGVFLRKQGTTEAKNEETKEREARAAESVQYVPFVVQPGINAPEGVRGGRFLVAFGTSTSFITTTSTYSVYLTAICKSTTNYSTCSGLSSGK